MVTHLGVELQTQSHSAKVALQRVKDDARTALARGGIG